VRIDLADDKCLVTPPGNGLADEFFRTAVAVHLGGVDQRRAEVKPETQRGDLLGARGAAVADVPGALAEGGNALARGQHDGFHVIDQCMAGAGRADLK